MPRRIESESSQIDHAEDFLGEPSSPFIDDHPLPIGVVSGEIPFSPVAQRRERKEPVVWGINLSENEFKFNKHHRKDFRACFFFMRELLWRLCEGDEAQLVELINFLSLYTKVDTSTGKLKFAELGELVLREILGAKKEVKTFNQVTLLPDGVREKLVERTFYYWVEIAHQLIPCKSLAISDDFEKRRTIAVAKQRARLTLDRAMAAIMMSRKIVQTREILTELGISLSQQEHWVRALLGAHKEGQKPHDEDFKDEEEFRHYAPTDPRIALEKEVARHLIDEIPKAERPKKLEKIISHLLLYLSDLESTVGTKWVDRQRLAALRWMRQRSEKERKEILGSLANRAGNGDLQDIFAKKCFSPSVRHNGKRIYSRRKDVAALWGPTLEMILEYLEAKPLQRPTTMALLAIISKSNSSLFLRVYRDLFLGGILAPPEPDSSAATALTAEAFLNMRVNSGLLNQTVKKVVEENIPDHGRRGFHLNKQEILKMLLAVSRVPFQSSTFLDNFRIALKEDLPNLDVC